MIVGLTGRAHTARAVKRGACQEESPALLLGAYFGEPDTSISRYYMDRVALHTFPNSTSRLLAFPTSTGTIRGLGPHKLSPALHLRLTTYSSSHLSLGAMLRKLLHRLPLPQNAGSCSTASARARLRGRDGLPYPFDSFRRCFDTNISRLIKGPLLSLFRSGLVMPAHKARSHKQYIASLESIQALELCYLEQLFMRYLVASDWTG